MTRAARRFLIRVRSFILALLVFAAVVIDTAGQCAISPTAGVKATEWDEIFTQDGPEKGLQPTGGPGWTGGDSTYSLLLPRGETAFFFSDSYIGEWPRTKGDGTVTRSPNGLRTTAVNCFPPLCDPAASSFIARNSIVVLDRDRKKMRTLVGPKNANGISTSYFKEPAPDRYFWMGDALLRKNKIIVFLHEFDPKLAFRGAAVAQLNARTLAIEKQLPIGGLPNMDIHWGTAMIEDSAWLYIYGKGARGGKKQMFVARTPAGTLFEQLAHSADWNAWDGKTWVKGLEKAEPIVPANDSVSDEFNVVRVNINGRPTYVFAGIDTTVPWGSWRDITLYSACAPQGPFTGKHFVYRMPEAESFTVPGLPAGERLKEHLVVYNPHIHKHLSRDGRLLISYNINRSHNSDMIYIDGYRPRFVYVPVAGLR